MTAPLLFIACHPADADICGDLEKRLVPPRRQGLLRFESSRSLCFDRAAIRAAIAEAHTVAFLLTNEYARAGGGSSDRSDRELFAMSRAATITIAAKPLDSHVTSCWLPRGKADLPRNGRPITRWPDKDEALAEIAEGLLETLAPKTPIVPPPPDPDHCPACHQVLPKRETRASWAKLLREMAAHCPNPALQAAALERAAELEALGVVKIPGYGEHVVGSHLDAGGCTKEDQHGAGCPGCAYDSEHVEGVYLHGKRQERRS